MNLFLENVQTPTEVEELYKSRSVMYKIFQILITKNLPLSLFYQNIIVSLKIGSGGCTLLYKTETSKLDPRTNSISCFYWLEELNL